MAAAGAGSDRRISATKHHLKCPSTGGSDVGADGGRKHARHAVGRHRLGTHVDQVDIEARGLELVGLRQSHESGMPFRALLAVYHSENFRQHGNVDILAQA